MDDAEFYKLVDAKDAKGVKAALKEGANPNATVKKTPALHRAIALKSKSVVKALVEGGTSIDLLDGEDKTPLMALSEHLRDTKLATALLDKGADIDAQDKEGNTALFLCCHQKKQDFMALLVERGADLEKKCGYNEETALMKLVRSDSGVMSATEKANALFLIDKGADIEASTESGETVMHLAAQSGAEDILELVLDKGAKPSANKWGGTPLHYCVSTHDFVPAIWDKLIAAGCSLEDKSHGQTVIMQAQSSWNPKAVAWFKGKGADLSAVDDDGKTVLERAQALGQDKVIKALG